eukprot:CAMPEP_0185606782 /NCGR_PEP_ID=MMETSP0436-20130131/5025_1 /TAXON_ID=626734 ORGANISM="Favella taraikaensis, Strain Fe Narragansett Bay" /NCGR_SAMPLE_ID=MMETSP0436 /ASSEMBLY_ACC=CAM_ASM_000390 /LENGTH=161 /DNA_ID=CAMNT_0028238469 /DNA_START=832 /DNA_END=1317 /DNA_ORIENTATION=-
MERVEHVEHLDKAHDTHALRAPRRVQLLAEVQAAPIRVAQVGAHEVGVWVELSTKVLQEVRLRRLEIVRLDRVQRLRETPERNHVVDLGREDGRIVKVVERRGDPAVRPDDVLVLNYEVFDRFHGHRLALLDLNLEVGALVHEFFVGAHADLAATCDAEED